MIFLLAGVAATFMLRSTNSVLLDPGVVAVLPFSLSAPDESDRWLAEAIPVGIFHLLDGTGGLTATPRSRTDIRFDAGDSTFIRWYLVSQEPGAASYQRTLFARRREHPPLAYFLGNP